MCKRTEREEQDRRNYRWEKNSKKERKEEI